MTVWMMNEAPNPKSDLGISAPEAVTGAEDAMRVCEGITIYTSKCLLRARVGLVVHARDVPRGELSVALGGGKTLVAQ